MTEINTTVKEKVVSLYKFIRELNKLKQNLVLNAKDYNWSKCFDEFPKDDRNILFYSQDRFNENSEAKWAILEVTKPEFEHCPEPQKCIKGWLSANWEVYRKKASFHEIRKIKRSESKFKYRLEYFVSDSRRVISYTSWIENRTEWVSKVRNSAFDFVNANCPEPDVIFKEWLFDGWENIDSEAAFKPVMRVSENDEYINDTHEQLIQLSQLEEIDDEDFTVEFFLDDPERVIFYNDWISKRELWVKRQIFIEKIRDFFTELYRIRVDLERDAETLELVVTNGYLTDAKNSKINIPIISKRVNIIYNASDNKITIEDTDGVTELYTALFQQIEDINLASIKELIEELQKEDYHPLDNNGTSEFLKRLIHQLSPDSCFHKESKKEIVYNSRLNLYWKPMLVVRKRLDKTVKVIEQIIKNIEDTGKVPSPIKDIVVGGSLDTLKEDVSSETIEERLASVGGESLDILLSKEANREQLEIAKRIEKFNAVIVQGPPGTGKTHTIANLLGHFLAKGKSVLVTSYTKKALSVLKGKVENHIQNLCVSMLDNSNKDMEKSIDGITDYMGRTTSFEIRRDMDSLDLERQVIINQLANVRKKLFAIINQESSSIVVNGEEISPSKAAKYVLDNREELSYIPGQVQLYKPLPLTYEEFFELYKSNIDISREEQIELDCNIPNPQDILSSEMLDNAFREMLDSEKGFEKIGKEYSCKIVADKKFNKITLDFFGFKPLIIDSPNSEALKRLCEIADFFEDFQPWMSFAIIDGFKGSIYKERWEKLIRQIDKTCLAAETLINSKFGKTVEYAENINLIKLKPAFEKLLSLFSKGKPSFFHYYLGLI